MTGRLERGRLVTEEVARFANAPVAVAEGARRTLYTDVLGLWAGVREGLRTAGRSGGLTSVGVDAWAVDHGLLDDDGALLGNPVHYRDARTDRVPERFFAAMSAEEHYRRTGLQVQPFNTVFQLIAAGGTPRLAAARGMLLLPDLLGHWLTGGRVAEVTNASTTGLLDPTTREWSTDVVAAASGVAGKDLSWLLAPLVEPGTVVGPLLGDVAGDLGLVGTRVVAVGSHDTASAVAAVPLGDPGRAAYISSGTWSLVGLELGAPVLTEASRAANVTNELGVAGTVRYLRNVAGLWLLQEALRTWSERGTPQNLPELLRAAQDVPALRTVLDVDAAVFASPGDMPARIAEVARAGGQPVPESPAEVVRCVLDSLALAYRRAVRAVAGLAGREVDVVHVVGGGARNELLCRLTADATGLPVVAGPAEGTAEGNLLVQAWSAGAIDGAPADDPAAGLARIREVVAASHELRRWEPAGDDVAWQRAEERLRDTAALS
ncbi:MAG: rhamnulokinase [Actinomycetales bacterium]|nr:rhamnulokinase [Actinomycetales bacterium]